MKKLEITIFVLVSILLIVPFDSFGQGGTVHSRSFTIQNLTRNYLLYVPAAYTGQEEWPLVINYHGYSGDPAHHMDIISNMNAIADTAHFLIAYPQGLIVEDLAFGGSDNGWHVFGSYSAPHDDVAFTDSLIDHVAVNYNIDLTRVHATGWSNGGEMAFYLACALPNKFASVASVANAMNNYMINSCRVIRPFPTLLIHGTADYFFPWSGLPPWWSTPPVTPSFWASQNNCSSDSIVTELADLDTTDNCTVTKIKYVNCDSSSEVLFYRVNNGGHSWPGSGFYHPNCIPTNMDISGSSEIWKFFKKFTNPYPDMAYGKSIEVNPKYLDPQGDTLSVLAEIANPENHQVEAYAMICNPDSTFQDSILLFDDGLHNDGNPNDNIYGGAKWFSGLSEENFISTLNTFDYTQGTKIKSYFNTSFTTIGPIVLDGYSITSSDTIPDDGDRIKFEYTLKNSGLTATAMNITSKVVPLDTFSTPINVTPNYGNIQPGQTAIGNQRQYIRFNHGLNPGIDVQFRIDIFSNNNIFWSDTFSVFVYSGLTIEDNSIPTEYSLKQNYPNPFNPTTDIQFSIPKTEFVTLKIFNLLGQEVTTLVSEKLTPGEYKYSWDASSLASGVYLYHLQAGEFTETRKMILFQ
jgi:polyhydroxybutyrate depolymerase